MEEETKKANLVAKILFIAGGIILFIVLVIFIFKIVPIAISGLSNIRENVTSGLRSNSSKEDIVVSSSVDEVEVKKPVIISFDYDSGEKIGQYYVSYECSNGLLFDIQSKDGPKRIMCDSPLVLGSNINSISLIPLFTEENNFSDANISISYRDAENKILASGSKTITVKDADAKIEDGENPYTVNGGTLSGSNVTTKPIETTTVVKVPTTTYTRPTKDLAITYAASVDSNSTFVIHVYNYGNTSTGPWEFSYTDAENPSRAVLSPVQASLGAGQGLAVTVRFDGQDNARQTIAINIDPYNKISETNESNNASSVIITGRTSNSGGSYDSQDDADLIITSMEVGRISGNRFAEDSEVDESDTAAVNFVVKNQGGESTGTWRFELTNLPYDIDDDYRSSTYSSLRPGESIEITVEFDGVDEGRYGIRLEVDPDDRVDEESERNNTSTETLRVER